MLACCVLIIESACLGGQPQQVGHLLTHVLHASMVHVVCSTLKGDSASSMRCQPPCSWPRCSAGLVVAAGAGWASPSKAFALHGRAPRQVPGKPLRSCRCVYIGCSQLLQCCVPAQCGGVPAKRLRCSVLREAGSLLRRHHRTTLPSPTQIHVFGFQSAQSRHYDPCNGYSIRRAIAHVAMQPFRVQGVERHQSTCHLMTRRCMQ
jgi:hypothetical protein